MRSNSVMAAVTLGLFAGASASAQTPTNASPTVVNDMLSCRSMADATARLACFDRSVSALSEAQAKGDLVTLDRQEVRKTRRSLFGLALPNLRILGDEDGAEEGSEIETRIVRTAAAADGKWVFELAEGGRWAQIDNRPFIVDPKAGQPIRIRRAPLGAYLANVNNQRAVRVKRLN